MISFEVHCISIDKSSRLTKQMEEGEGRRREECRGSSEVLERISSIGRRFLHFGFIGGRRRRRGLRSNSLPATQRRRAVEEMVVVPAERAEGQRKELPGAQARGQHTGQGSLQNGDEENEEKENDERAQHAGEDEPAGHGQAEDEQRNEEKRADDVNEGEPTVATGDLAQLLRHRNRVAKVRKGKPEDDA